MLCVNCFTFLFDLTFYLYVRVIHTWTLDFIKSFIEYINLNIQSGSVSAPFSGTAYREKIV